MQKKILIVDFEEESIKEIQNLLKDEDFAVLTASDGERALGVFQSNNPDLVIATALLPKINGFELCKKITGGELGVSKPVIMYSAIYKAEKYRKEAMANCGAIEFLDKPIPKWQLLKAIKAAFVEIPAGESNLRPPKVVSVGNSSMPGAIDDGHDVLDAEALFDSLDSIEGESENRTLDLDAKGIAGTAEINPSSIASINSAEIEAALDAVRIDLDPLTNKSEPVQAERVDENPSDGTSTLLEFETAQQRSTNEPAAAAVGEFELDEVLPEVMASSEPTLGDKSASVQSVPDFGLQPTDSRRWLPLAILVILLLIALVWWLKG